MKFRWRLRVAWRVLRGRVYPVTVSPGSGFGTERLWVVADE